MSKEEKESNNKDEIESKEDKLADMKVIEEKDVEFKSIWSKYSKSDKKRKKRLVI